MRSVCCVDVSWRFTFYVGLLNFNDVARRWLVDGCSENEPDTSQRESHNQHNEQFRYVSIESNQYMSELHNAIPSLPSRLPILSHAPNSKKLASEETMLHQLNHIAAQSHPVSQPNTAQVSQGKPLVSDTSCEHQALAHL